MKLLLFLTLLPLTVATLAFLLQWLGGNDSAITLATPFSAAKFLGIQRFAPSSTTSVLSHPACGTLSAHSSPSFPYFRNWEFHHQPHLKPNIAITTTTSASLEQILPWIFFHKIIGVTSFYLFVEGKAASLEALRVLESIPGVKVLPRTQELEEEQSRSRIWKEKWLSNFFYKPCNYELFVKQTLNMEMAISLARNDGVDWILHLDTDELVHPAGTKEYSLKPLLLNVPSNVDMVILTNYEGSVESSDLQDPFSEVSLFKKNFDHVANDTYSSMYKEATRGNPSYFLTYGNGKAIARIQDNLRPNGAHRWYNYAKIPKEMKLQEAAVLHYTYAKFSDLTSRRDRCRCKPTKEDLHRCFMLEFDRQAFIIASSANDQEMRKWYEEHVVWGNQELKMKLLEKGILIRIYTPMVIIQSLRESGVFTSVIASAATNPSKDLRSLPPNGKSVNSSIVSQTTTRKLLEVSDVKLPQEAAIPPLSPPVLQM